MQAPGKLTRSSLSYLLCSDSENIQYFNHYLNNDVRHRRRWWNLGICLQAFEKVFDPFEDVDQGVLGCTDILGRLMSVDLNSIRKDTYIEYRPEEGHQLLRRSLLQVRKPSQ